MRRRVTVVLVLVGMGIVLVGLPSLLVSPSTAEIAPNTEADGQPDIVNPTGGDSGFWPYLNSRRAFEQRSSINVVVVGETEQVIALLSDSPESNWEETPDEELEADPATYAIGTDQEPGEPEAVEDFQVGPTNITWTRTTGATRYTYLDPGPDGDARWVDETAQVHDGTYYGHRYHVRMYESPDPEDRWVAMQTHDEHFDWLTLRHRVHGTQAAQARLEADLMALPQVDVTEDVRRVYLENENSRDTDGWATFVDLLGAIGVVFLPAVAATTRIRAGIDARLTPADRQRLAALRDRVAARHLVLAGTILAIVLGVRVGGITLERAGVRSMHAIAVALYPFIAVGLPLAAYLIARGLERRLDAGLVAGTALAAAIWIDYGLLGVSSLPIDVVVQRLLVVIALGLVAAGATRPSRADGPSASLLLAGITMWVVLLAGTLFGYL